MNFMKNRLARATISLLAGLLLAISMTACKNTAHGAGKDIEEMGEKIQEKTD
ncbi:MAG: hypothetical protein AB7O66_05485 [Limisphaerales bacterium]